MFVVVAFVGVSFLTIVLSLKLSRCADNLARVTQLNRGIIGIFLLAAITSFPELFSSGSAAFMGKLDLAFGNVFGSNMTNIFLLAILDFMMGGRDVWSHINTRNITSSLVVGLQSCTLVLMFLGTGSFVGGPLVAGTWYFSVLVVVLYCVSMKLVYSFETHAFVEDDEVVESAMMSRSKVIRQFVLVACGVLVVAFLLSYFCDQLSAFKVNGVPLGGSFVGSLFMAVVTSLPELVVTVSALRLGSYEMALGNIFGSNLFNLCILGVSEWSWRLGLWFGVAEMPLMNPSVFSAVSPVHFISGLFGIMMLAVVSVASMFTSHEKRMRFSYASVSVTFLFVLGMYLVFVCSRM